MVQKHKEPSFAHLFFFGFGISCPLSINLALHDNVFFFKLLAQRLHRLCEFYFLLCRMNSLHQSSVQGFVWHLASDHSNESRQINKQWKTTVIHTAERLKEGFFNFILILLNCHGLFFVDYKYSVQRGTFNER